MTDDRRRKSPAPDGAFLWRRCQCKRKIMKPQAPTHDKKTNSSSE